MTQGNGVATTYTYDDGLLSRIAAQYSTTTYVSFDYTYDAQGNRSGWTYNDGKVYTFLHDYHGQLTSAILKGASGQTLYSSSYGYDGANNRSSGGAYSGYTYDAANRLTSTSASSYGYDLDGNMNSETDGSSYTYTYDREGRVTAQTGPSLTISYKYDALGRRIEQTVNGTVTKYVLNGDHVLADLNGSGTTIARYTNGPRVDEIISVRTGGQTYYYTQDALGSVVRILDQNRATKNTYEYLPWGEIYAQTEVIANRYTFTGRERNADGRTMHYRARGYLPHTGRFGQEDPLGFIDGINAYRYVRNSPCTFVDPSGLSCASGIGSLVFSTVGAVLSGVGFVISAGSEIATFGLSTPASVPGMAISAAGWSVSVGSMAFGIAEIAEECGKKKDAPEKEDK